MSIDQRTTTTTTNHVNKHRSNESLRTLDECSILNMDFDHEYYYVLRNIFKRSLPLNSIRTRLLVSFLFIRLCSRVALFINENLLCLSFVCQSNMILLVCLSKKHKTANDNNTYEQYHYHHSQLHDMLNDEHLSVKATFFIMIIDSNTMRKRRH
jgi:hypothetical protein